jgi:hypothetical protein
VVEATGRLIFGATSAPTGPVRWIHHDLVARCLNAAHGDTEGATQTGRVSSQTSHLSEVA